MMTIDITHFFTQKNHVHIVYVRTASSFEYPFSEIVALMEIIFVGMLAWLRGTHTVSRGSVLQTAMAYSAAVPYC